MHIGLVTMTLKPGGAQRLVLEEARHLQDRGHSVTVYPQADDEAFRENIDMGDLRVREYPSFDLTGLPLVERPLEIAWLRKHFVDDGIDVLISHNHDIDVYLATRGTDIEYSCHVNGSPFWFPYSGPLLPHSRKSRFQTFIDAVDGHGEFIDLREYSKIKQLYHEVREPLRARALQKSGVVTTLTNRVAKELGFCYDIDVRVVRPGVGTEWFDIDIEATASDIEGVTTDHAIMNVGRLDKRKRNHLLIRAFAGIADERDDVTLIIGGTGDQEDKLRSGVDELGLQRRVVFPGYISEDELPMYYAAVDILAHPAWTAYGLVPLEAYVLGTKVAISSDSGVQEIISGEPGVEIISPEVAAWREGLSELLDAPAHTPNRAVVPTWEDYFDDKYEVFVANGFL